MKCIKSVRFSVKMRFSFSHVVRAVSILPVLCVILLMSVEYYGYVLDFLWRSFENNMNAYFVLCVLECIVFHVLFGMVVWSYYRVVMTGAFTRSKLTSLTVFDATHETS